MTWLEISRPGGREILLARRDLDASEENAGFLSSDEIRRAGRFTRDEDARRFVAGRAWLRRSLGELLGVAPERIVLAAGAFGRPELREPDSSLTFSLAHAGARALLAVSLDGRVGVDVEARNAAPDADTLAARALAARELAEFHELPIAERETFFLARWTAKEALLKAAGIGLSSDPARIALEPQDDGSFRGTGEPRIAGLRAWPVDAGPGFIAALAAESD